MSLAFPDLFPQDTLRAAVETVLGMRPGYFGPVRVWLESDAGLPVRNLVAEVGRPGDSERRTDGIHASWL